MIDVFNLIQDIRFKTELLEALEWDEDLLETFLYFFDNEIKSSSDPDYVLTNIKDNFGIPLYDIIVRLFKAEASIIDEYIDNDTEH
jgi:hypothetical protein